jgi:calcineurin-like phosphoesterase family protein
MEVEESDNLIISNWNKTVNKHDKVYILGDITLDKPQVIKDVIPKLNGIIEVIAGNHDTPRCIEALIECGCKVSAYGEYHGWLLSHIPVDVTQLDKYIGNVHGHIHLSGKLEGYGHYVPLNPNGNYINVNCEFHNYTPVRLDILIDEYEQSHKLGKYGINSGIIKT